MKDRIRKLRRHLDMTQEEFAKKIGVKRNTVAQYETGRNAPVDSVLFLICKEFGVNEEWLRYGDGEMMKPAPTDELDMLQCKYNLSHGMYILIEKLVHAKPEVQDMIVDMITEVAESIRSGDVDPCSRPSNHADIALDEINEEHLHEELDRQIKIEKCGKGKSEAS